MLTSSQLNLPHGTKQKRTMKKLKTKNGDTQKKRFGREVRGVSPEAGRESMVGKICDNSCSINAVTKCQTNIQQNKAKIPQL